MKKTKLIAGILLMVLGLGMSIGSVVLRFCEHGRYGMMNTRHGIIKQRGMMGGPKFFNSVPPASKQNSNQNQNQNNNQNQNKNQNANGGG